MLTVNGWIILAHPLFLDQMERLTAAVERQTAKAGNRPPPTANAKLLAAIHALIFDRIPADPASSFFRQGGTLGPDRKHWFRAKFGNGRFRLFFRYNSAARIIIYAWVNDDQSLRTYGARTDAYRVFAGMLDDGNPPDDWPMLLKAASDPKALERLSRSQPGEAGQA
ncbi:type II toxin-antitoxin system YhaV family toxin [Rhizobium sp. AAP43]|uniref:type II toxin-antitoxin system YhaV family toxin n=1 Tax=Rhizobium sp. AAP43 TaxID=1523420 RepID=UPI0006B98CF8|nr:type II toxin-antitoxin system YhaV family toxin [Rhizobium sp. AAP43]KPF41103.1 toxin [Rhizobium sp. AAP43]